MASSPILRGTAPNQYWQIKWSYLGKGRQRTYPVDQPGLAQRCSDYVSTIARNAIFDTDPAIDRYVYGGNEVLVEAAQLVLKGANRKPWSWVIEQWRATKSCQPQTVKLLAARLYNHTQAWMARPVDDIGWQDLNALYDQLTGTLATSTAENYMATVCEVLNFAYAADWTTFFTLKARKGKLLKFKSPTPSGGERDALEVEEVLAILDELERAQDRLMLRFLLGTAARIGEACAAGVSGLDPARGEFLFAHRMLGSRRAVGTKGSRGRPVDKDKAVVLDTTLLGLLVEHVAGRSADEPLFAHPRTGAFMTGDFWRNQVFKPAVARAAAKGRCRAEVTPHWTRHTTGSLVQALLPATLVQDQMRHQTLSTTKGYLHRPLSVVEAMRKGLDEGMGAFDRAA